MTERERDLAPCRIDTDHAIFLAATGEQQQAWRVSIASLSRGRLTEESPPEPTTWWLIRMAVWSNRQRLDAELATTARGDQAAG